MRTLTREMGYKNILSKLQLWIIVATNAIYHTFSVCILNCKRTKEKVNSLPSMKEFVLIEIVADMEGQIKPEGITSIFTLSDLFK